MRKGRFRCERRIHLVWCEDVVAVLPAAANICNFTEPEHESIEGYMWPKYETDFIVELYIKNKNILDLWVSSSCVVSGQAADTAVKAESALNLFLFYVFVFCR